MSSDFIKLVGERIRAIRKERNFTQEFLAEKAEIHSTYISDIERGGRNISMETLEKVINALDVSPIEVFRIEGIEAIEDRADKKLLIEALNSLLAGRKTAEVQMILRLAKDVLSTFDNLNE